VEHMVCDCGLVRVSHNLTPSTEELEHESIILGTPSCELHVESANGPEIVVCEGYRKAGLPTYGYSVDFLASP
jgi:hypothetical protein